MEATSASLVIDLAGCGRRPLAEVGGKAAGLGRLIDLGLPVPPGLCLTAAAYREHAARPAVRPALDAALAAPGAGDRGRRAESLAALREAIAGEPPGDAVRREVEAALADLELRAAAAGWMLPLRLAVRSSAAAEDLCGRTTRTRSCGGSSSSGDCSSSSEAASRRRGRSRAGRTSST